MKKSLRTKGSSITDNLFNLKTGRSLNTLLNLYDMFEWKCSSVGDFVKQVDAARLQPELKSSEQFIFLSGHQKCF